MTIILIYTHDGYKVICIFTLHAINLLYVDQSTGTGFSFSSDNRDLHHNEDRVSNDLYDFLQRFAIGNGLTDLVIRCKAYFDYALEMGIIQQSEYKNVNKMFPAFELATKLCVGISALLENGVKLLIYAGEYDLICNCLGNSRWVHTMEWSGHKQFVGSPIVPFVVDGAKAGQMKSYGSLSFLKVHDADHMVPIQPKATLEMLKRWTKGKLVENTETEDVVTDM
ncbi:hypothetical protein GIB67_013728 [Kingdonia uniflora]|uniref:Uncharacterized protein n=1 Tax=Kingdonia uniflora TaxID=39325 RepID=A0A7J7NQU8_9MAGN|nr:hypothetical protein GIB67_013728 [Kingdonia uniflora]